MTRIEIDQADADGVALWQSMSELVMFLPGEWVLIGGLMVQLHALQGGQTIRVTRDIDVLAQARPPGALEAIDAALQEHGFVHAGPDLDGYAHRYERNGLQIDLVAPDGIKPPPTLGGGLKAVGIPGGSQALKRAETVTVGVAGIAFELRRPTLLGAILIKARSLMVHADPDTQREDLIRLLALVEDPRALATELGGSERRWLCNAETRLKLNAPSTVSAADVRRAALAYRLLIQHG